MTHSEQFVIVLLVALDGHKLGTGLIIIVLCVSWYPQNTMMKKELVFNLTYNTECVKVVLVHRHHSEQQLCAVSCVSLDMGGYCKNKLSFNLTHDAGHDIVVNIKRIRDYLLNALVAQLDRAIPF